VESHGGVAVLAATTAIAAVVVPIPVVVAVVTVAAVVLVRWARRRQGWRQWSGRRFVGVECRRSSSWTEGVQVDFLHHGIHLDVEVGDDGVDVRRRSVTVSVVEEDVDPGTSFLAVVCHSRSAAVACSLSRS
jgi:hypothetical protein